MGGFPGITMNGFHVSARVAALGALILFAPLADAGKPVPPEQVRFIHMGGNDCPPCRVWRAMELPKLEQSPGFRSVSYTYVTKTVRSPVPPAMFLPDEIKQYKAKLDEASGGRAGSPHQLLMVNGEVYDYWFGVRDAHEIEAAITALLHGTQYPHQRCVRRTGDRSGACAVRGSR